MQIKITASGHDCILEDSLYGKMVIGECTPAIAKYIGLKLGVFEESHSLGLRSRGGFHEAHRQIDAVVDTSKKHIAKARGQIEEEGCEEKLSDIDVAIMDVYAREVLAEAARDVDNPFARQPDFTPPWIRIPAPYLEDMFEEIN